MELALQIVVILMVEFASQMKLALQISLVVEFAGEMELAGQTVVTLTAKTVVT